VTPFKTGARIANSYKPGVPYGLLLNAHAQPCGKRNLTASGFVVSAFYVVAGSTLLDESVSADCPNDPCSPWG